MTMQNVLFAFLSKWSDTLNRMLEMAADRLASSETYYLHNINFVKMNYLLFTVLFAIDSVIKSKTFLLKHANLHQFFQKVLFPSIMQYVGTIIGLKIY